MAVSKNNTPNINPIVIQIGILLVSLGTIYGILSTQVSTVRLDLITFQTRYEREVVPRSEHIQMNSVLEQRLQSILERQLEAQKQVEQLQGKMDELLRKR